MQTTKNLLNRTYLFIQFNFDFFFHFVDIVLSFDSLSRVIADKRHIQFFMLPGACKLGNGLSC